MKKYIFFIILFISGVITSFAQQKKYITYRVKEGETIEIIAKKLSITPYDLLKLNPDIKNNVSINDIIVIPNNQLPQAYQEVENISLDYLTDKDIIVDNFIYHEIQKKETLYSILKKYKTEIDILNKLNPLLIEKGLQYGEVLKIPIHQADLAELSKLSNQEKYTQPYIVKAKETKFGIAKEHNISVAYLEELNPKVKKNGLQMGDVIMVPKQIAPSNNSNYTIHTVKKMETFFSLSNMYGVSKEELIAENPELKDGVKEGMLLKIPNVIHENDALFTDRIYPDKTLNIAMMLPFKRKNDTLDFKNDKLLKITTDFYLGSLIAIDSLKKQGLSIHLKVYDTENSAFVSDKLSKRSEFINYDAVIGPLFLKNVAAVSKNLRLHKPLIISPISAQDHSKINNKNLVQSKASNEDLTKEMIAFLKSKYNNQNLIIIEDEDGKLSPNEKYLMKDIRSLDSLKNISILKPKKGYIKLDIIKTKLDSLNENWVVLVGKDDVLIADAIHNLGVIPENYNLTLFALNKPKGLDKIDNTFLSRVNFHYPTAAFMDEQSELLKQFDQKYLEKYYTYPSKYAIDGFDATYDILMRLSSDNNLIQQGVSKRLATKYHYIHNHSGSILNSGIFIVKYDGLELKPAD
jgi:LysM repeat protein